MLGLGSLAKDLGHFFLKTWVPACQVAEHSPRNAFLLNKHTRELRVRGEEGKEREGMVKGVPSAFLRASQAWLLCPFRKGPFTLIQAGI